MNRESLLDDLETLPDFRFEALGEVDAGELSAALDADDGRALMEVVRKAIASYREHFDRTCGDAELARCARVYRPRSVA